MEDRIPANHPLRDIRKLTNAVLANLSDRFDEMYPAFGRPSIARLVYMGHVLMENRNCLAVTRATGTAERDAAAIFMKELRRSNHRPRVTLGADKGYDTKAFVEELKANRSAFE